MSETPEPSSPELPAPLAGFANNPRAAFLTVPVLLGAAMILAGVSWAVVVMNTSGEARGATVRAEYSSDCANAVISQRLADYGLPGTFAGSTLTLTLAGVRGDDTVPATLARRGLLTLTADGKDVPFAIDEAGLQISVTGTAVTLLTMKESLPQLGVQAFIDGEEVEVESVNSNELMLAARGPHSTDALRIATDRLVIVRYPLPCDVKLVGVTPVSE